jgi:hydrogenase/urease accessory protein HupE
MISQIISRCRFGLLTLLTAFLLIVTFTMPSPAHWADLAVGEINIQTQDAVFNLTVPTGLVSLADDDRNGKLDPAEVDRHRPALQQHLADRIQLRDQQGRSGELSVQAIAQTPGQTPGQTSGQTPVVPQANTQTHSSLQLNYHFAQPLEELTLRYNLFIPDVSTARCLVTTLHQGKTQSVVFTPTNSEFTLMSRSIVQQVYSFVGLGFEHILTGYDHILFLVSLLLVSNRLKDIIKIVTAFTLAHSITLSLAVLNIVSLPSQWVECAIALSIVYVAAENLWQKNFNHRFWLTFGFGLVHGLGFAGILREIQIPQSQLVTSLVSFNVGVELGQILIVLLLSLGFQALKTWVKSARWQLNIQHLMSIGIVVTGLVWFFQRI